MNEDQNPDEELNPKGPTRKMAIKKTLLMPRLLEKTKRILIHHRQRRVKPLPASLECTVSGFWIMLVMLF